MTTTTLINDNKYSSPTISADSFIYTLLDIRVDGQQPLLTIEEALAAIEQRLNKPMTATL